MPVLFFELLLPFTKEQCVMCKEKEKWKRNDKNCGHLMLEKLQMISSLAAVQLEKGIAWFMKCKCSFFFSFHTMNEKVKIREPRHTVAKPYQR